MRLLAEIVVIAAGVPAKPKPGEGWSRASRSQRWTGSATFKRPNTLAKAQISGDESVPQPRDQRVEDNAFHPSKISVNRAERDEAEIPKPKLQVSSKSQIPMTKTERILSELL